MIVKSWIILLLFVSITNCNSQDEIELNKSDVKRIVNSYIDALFKDSPFDDSNQKIKTGLNKNLREGKYDELHNPKRLAADLSKDIITLTGDYHFGIDFDPALFEALKSDSSEDTNEAAALDQLWLKEELAGNFYFEEIKDIENDLLYVKITQIPRIKYCKALVDSVMNLAVTKKGLIIDLRNNTGGADGFAQYLSSYFLPKNTKLFTRISKNESYDFISEEVPSKEWHQQIPLFILVNGETVSAAEQLPYLLQNHDRVTVIGEKTFGAAHGSIDVPLSYGLVGFVPMGYEKHIKTSRDWEATGVMPDVLTSSEKALEKAISLSNLKLHIDKAANVLNELEKKDFSDQTFVGEVLYRNSYEYVKLECKKGACIFSLPFVDDDTKYKVQGEVLHNKAWSVSRGIEEWKFKTVLKEGVLKGELSFPLGRQNILLKKQKQKLSKSQMQQFVGIFEDKDKRRAILYFQYNYVMINSPYSENNSSLKRIGENEFWTNSGEQLQFKDLTESGFQSLCIKDRLGNEYLLEKKPPVAIQDLWIEVGKDTIYGKLYLPYAKEKVPAALILPGGGATGMEHYEMEARFLASHGLACIVFDKSGHGKSKGPSHFQVQTFEEKNEQYKQLFKYLKQHPKIDSNTIGVVGLSEGGRLALMMAMDLKEKIAFANAIAAPVMTMEEVQLYAINQRHRAMGIKEADHTRIQQIWSDYFSGIIEGKIDPEVIERALLYAAQGESLLLPLSAEIPTAPNKYDLVNDRVAEEAGNIKCPVFFQYGENDQIVNQRKSLRNFLAKASKSIRVDTKIYNRGNHSFNTPEQQICAGYLNDKLKWLKSIGIL